jgi:putative membrane protein
MYKLKLALMIVGLGAMSSYVGGSLATMQDRSTESTQTNQNNSNQNRNSNRNTNGNSNRSRNMNSSMNSNMTMNSNSMMNSNVSSTMMSDDANALDADFAKMAAMGGMAEIRWAEVAQQRSTSKEVKKYASRMIKDHTKAGKNLQKVAAKKSMTLPTTMSDEQMQILNQLQQASGAEFDRMYIEMSGVQAHQKMEALFQNQATNGTDADLKSFASKTLPTVQMHLRMAQEMANGGMNGGSMSSNSMNSGSMNSNSKSNSNSNSNVNR